MSRQQLLIGGQPGGLIVRAADFDGSTDYMTKGSNFSGIANSKTFTLVVWFHADTLAAGGSRNYLFQIPTTVAGTTTVIAFFYDGTAGKLEVLARNSSGSDILDSTNFAPSTATWYCVMISVDLTSSSKRWFYVGDSPQSPSWITYLNDTISFAATGADVSVGAQASGASKFDGCIGPIWFEDGLYTDFSIQNNRRKFFTISGKPANLGTDGSVPFGSSPIMYNFIASGGAASTFPTNNGTGGNLTDKATLSLCASSPSD